MSIKINIAITPVGVAAVALAQAHQEQQSNSGNPGAGKARRIKHEWKIPGTHSLMETIRTEADAKVKGSLDVYNCLANPADYLIGINAFSSNSMIVKAVPVQLALFKTGLKAQLPDLMDSVLEGVTEDHCKLESFTMPFYFEFESETEAYRAWLDWHQHLKVAFDGANRLPTRTNGWKKSPPRVLADLDCRDAFIAMLPFGQARFALKRDPSSYPSITSNAQSLEARKALLAHTRCLLCIEIKVDIAKFYYTDSSELDLCLPTDARLWHFAKMPEDPVKAIWDKFRWETWLEANLLNEADLTADVAEDEKAVLNWQLQEVADAYLAGEYVQRNQHIDNDPKKFVKYREALIAKAQIDILNPWAINKLNLGKVLSPNYTCAARFQPQKNSEFGPYTLSNQTINGAIRRLDSAMQGKPGWAFDASAYQEKTE